MQMDFRNLVFLKFTVLLLSVFIHESAANSAGANAAACVSMYPSHGTSVAQSGSGAFSVTASPTTYNFSSTTITVTLSASSGSFQGYLVQARSIDWQQNQNVPLGTFSTAPANTQNLCAGATGDAITHNPKATISSKVLTWTALPGVNPGHIEFLATFVVSYTVFHVKVSSGNVTEVSTAPVAAPTTTASTASTAAPVAIGVSSSGCGSSKGCFRAPGSCGGSSVSSCDFFVTWQQSGTNVTFIMTAQTNGYVAMGLSSDTKMGTDDVIACTRDPTTSVIAVEYGSNVGNSYVTYTGAGSQLTLIRSSYVGGELTCEFQRPITSTAGQSSLQDTWYLIMAKGDTVSAGGIIVLQQHTLQSDGYPVVSSERVNFLGNGDYRPAGYPLVKAHGSLMLVAWLACGSIGVIMARYFKDAWPEKMPGGAKVWFQVHRALMISNLGFTVISFVIIFVSAGGYSKMSGFPDAAHPILGIIVTVFVIANPVMSIFRCAPDDPRRPAFNWAHWSVGISALVLATVCCGTGVNLAKASYNQYLFTIVIGWVVISLVFVIVLEIVSRKAAAAAKANKGSGMELKEKTEEKDSGAEQSAEKTMKVKLLVFFLFVGVTVAAVLSTIICLAIF